MKIAIASEGKSIDSEISSKGGRALYYLIFEDKKLTEIIKNPFAIGGGGSGWSVIHMLADKKVDLVVTGKIGPNMESALKEKGIKFEEKEGKVFEVDDVLSTLKCGVS